MDTLQEKADKMIEKNRKWARSPIGKKAMEIVTGEGYDKLEIVEFTIFKSIRDTYKEGNYIGLERVAKAIREGIGCDLPVLIKTLQRYEKKLGKTFGKVK
jgi:hypothetical protein